MRSFLEACEEKSEDSEAIMRNCFSPKGLDQKHALSMQSDFLGQENVYTTGDQSLAEAMWMGKAEIFGKEPSRQLG